MRPAVGQPSDPPPPLLRPMGTSAFILVPQIPKKTAKIIRVLLWVQKQTRSLSERWNIAEQKHGGGKRNNNPERSEFSVGFTYKIKTLIVKFETEVSYRTVNIFRLALAIDSEKNLHKNDWLMYKLLIDFIAETLYWHDQRSLPTERSCLNQLHRRYQSVLSEAGVSLCSRKHDRTTPITVIKPNREVSFMPKNQVHHVKIRPWDKNSDRGSQKQKTPF